MAWMDDLDPAWLVALPLVSQPSIDGFADEWATDAESEWSATTTVAGDSGSVEAAGRLGWDESGLFVLATVTDPQVVQQWHDSPGQLWQGDSVSMEVSLEAAQARDQSLLLSDVHVLLGPDDGAGGGTLGVVNPVVEQGGDFTFGSGGVDDRIEVASVFLPEGEGYQVEALIPWEVLDLVNPPNGTVLAANVNISTGDQDGFQGMVSTNPARVKQAESACWNRLLLWDDPEVSPDARGVELVAGGAASPTWSEPLLTWDSLADVELAPPDCA